MKNLINSITMLIVLFIVLLIILIAAVIFFYFSYQKKNTYRSEQEETDPKTVKVINSDEWLPIEDIVDGMIIDKYGGFHAAIECKGVDFYTANNDEKLAIQNHYIDFIFALAEPISYRQYGESINMEYTIKRYQDKHQQVQAELFNLTEDCKAASEFMAEKSCTEVERKEIEQYLKQSKTKMKSLNWRIQHIESQLRYLESVSGIETGKQHPKQVYIVTWKNAWNPISKPLTGEALKQKAIIELNKLCRSKIYQLSDSGAVARRYSTVELVDMCRRHCFPVTGERYTLDNVRDSTFFEDIISTDCLDERNQEFEEDIVTGILYGDI